ncbi:MAG TPA: DUF2950 domain-containing protein [Tepidisphaeraceae bacterium]|jgi:hypothetical protein|nr:DUF2950 domain-containing protein [Tepidisphaeraceae bacterium]
MKFAKSLFAFALIIVAMTNGCASSQTTFASPEDGARQLVAALRANDTKTVEKILGQGSKDILFSGDEVADNIGREQFLQAYDEKEVLTPNDDGSMTLVVGSKDWPMPIPIVKDDKGKWRFDTLVGKDEILNRRIGRNELDVIQVCQAIVDAQREYAQRDPEKTGLPVYADRIISEPGKHNGLYWETGPNEQESPLGPLVAAAVGEGYGKQKSAGEARRPYHGYYYRLLKEQGPNAAGGARSYVVNDKLLAGFGVVAYPADYGNSGIMTFIVNQDGVVYQRDFGDDTASVAGKMTAFDPGPQWKRVDQP